MTFQAVIFDLDGTLLDTLKDLANSYNRVLKQKGFPTHSIDAYRTFVGDGARMCVTRALPESQRKPSVIDNCLELFLEDYAQHWNIFTQPYHGIPELLNALVHQHLKIAVLSNKPHAFTKKCMEAYFSSWKFEIVFGQTETLPQKPDPTMALNISAHLSIPPDKILFVGDTHVDMKTASRAGMYPVGVLWGFRSRAELIKNGAKSIVKTPEEILPIITES